MPAFFIGTQKALFATFGFSVFFYFFASAIRAFHRRVTPHAKRTNKANGRLSACRLLIMPGLDAHRAVL
jgi:hypothetical protein